MGSFLDSIIADEMPVIKKAPRIGVIVFICGATVGAACSYWYLSDRMSDQNERMTCLQISTGMAKPSAQTPLTCLTNAELKMKSSHLVERIREIVSIHKENSKSLAIEMQTNKMTADTYSVRIDQEKQRAWKQFDIIRVDALMVCDELRSRLSPLVHEKVVTNTPTFRSADEPKAELSVGRLLSAVSIDGAGMLAGEIEHLSKLQLTKLEACAC